MSFFIAGLPAQKLIKCLVLWMAFTGVINPGLAQTALSPGSPETEHISRQKLASIDRLLQNYCDSIWISGATALIARHGKVVYYKAFGSTGPESKRKMDRESIFRIASQTKAVTSVAVMMLYEEGLFLLDDPISKYLPEFAHPRVLDHFNEKDSSFTTFAAKREITIRDLLTHTSGIDYPEIGSANMQAIYQKAGVPAGFVAGHLRLAEKMKILASLPIATQPGTRFTYGLSTDVLGYLVERLSHRTLLEFFAERIFKPLGMKDTYFYLPAEKASRLVSVGTPAEKGHLKTWDNSTFKGITADYPLVKGTYYSGGAGLSSTILDYAVFLQMLLDKGSYNGHILLSPSSVELMTCNQIGDVDFGASKFGLGFSIITDKSHAELGQSPGTFGWGGFYGTRYSVDPVKGLIYLVFMQQYPFPHAEVTNKFKAAVYQSLLE